MAKTSHSKPVLFGKGFLVVSTLCQPNSLPFEAVQNTNYLQGLGVIILGVGLHSHFKSTWTSEFPYQVILGGQRFTFPKTYEICKPYNEMKDLAEELGAPADAIPSAKCPSISLERYFVAAVIICFILSLANLVLTFVMDLKSGAMKYADVGCHIVAAVLLIVAGAVYIVSAKQIGDMLDLLIPDASESDLKKLDIYTRNAEKMAAGVGTKHL